VSTPEQAPEWYRVVDASEVDPKVCSAATAILDFVRGDLHLPTSLHVAWVLPATSEEERADHIRRYEPVAQNREVTKFRTPEAYDCVGLNSLYVRTDQGARVAALQVAYRAKLYQMWHEPAPCDMEDPASAALKYAEVVVSNKFRPSCDLPAAWESD
jgi:hypothetical protein